MNGYFGNVRGRRNIMLLQENIKIVYLFGVDRSTMWEIVQETCATIVQILFKKYIKFPQADKL